jgi:hypothetical protein
VIVSSRSGLCAKKLSTQALPLFFARVAKFVARPFCCRRAVVVVQRLNFGVQLDSSSAGGFLMLFLSYRIKKFKFSRS